MSRAAAISATLALPALVALLAGCTASHGEPERPGTAYVASQIPAGAALSTALEPGLRWPAGSRVVRLESGSAGPVSTLSDGMLAAGGASLSRDGRLVLFLGREEEGGTSGVYLSGIRGGDRRRLTDPALDCGGAAFLTDERIVFSARVDGDASGLPTTTPWALFVLEIAGGAPTRVSFSGGAELDPVVTCDGRVLYTGWRPAPGGGSFALFTIHPDGTEVTLCSDALAGAPRSVLQADDGDLFVVGSRAGESAVQILEIDWRAPMRALRAIACEPGEPAAAQPIAGGRLLVAALPDGDRPGGVCILDADGQVVERPLRDDPAWLTVQIAEARPSRRPQGHLSLVKPDREDGDLVCIDARSPGMNEASFVRFRLGERSLGEVVLAADGSFFARVPCDQPLTVELLDAAGRPLGRSHTPFWVRPGEVRGCIGCHEDRATAPPNVRPQAVLGEPMAPAPLLGIGGDGR